MSVYFDISLRRTQHTRWYQAIYTGRGYMEVTTDLSDVIFVLRNPDIRSVV